jgi:hypothetical protein
MSGLANNRAWRTAVSANKVWVNQAALVSHSVRVRGTIIIAGHRSATVPRLLALRAAAQGSHISFTPKPDLELPFPQRRSTPKVPTRPCARAQKTLTPWGKAIVLGKACFFAFCSNSAPLQVFGRAQEFLAKQEEAKEALFATKEDATTPPQERAHASFASLCRISRLSLAALTQTHLCAR